ncbi:uncharacterized protein SOCEGT47_027530 [Sorangium cellulosum]|uniref:Uncharacterized protein n=1 Tax=Sorangium cellulosum TaxID=56 RepID=A0A4V0NDD1_SORCE|nr:uncharacterized protein SOCEGT47_027530 [Sorangium cellulosum]
MEGLSQVPWARRLRRTHQVAVLSCAGRGGETRLSGVVTEPAAAREILARPGLPLVAPQSRARDPTEGMAWSDKPGFPCQPARAARLYDGTAITRTLTSGSCLDFELPVGISRCRAPRAGAPGKAEPRRGGRTLTLPGGVSASGQRDGDRREAPATDRGPVAELAVEVAAPALDAPARYERAGGDRACLDHGRAVAEGGDCGG